MLTYLILGATFGFAAAAQPGPFQAFLVSQTISAGWRRTLPAVLAPLLTDGPIVLLVLVVLRQVPAGFTPMLQLLGGAFLLYLAAEAFRTWRRMGEQAAAAPERQRTVLKAAVVNLLNPNPYISWSLVLGPLLIQGWREEPARGLALLAGFYGTMLSGMAATVGLVAVAKRLGPAVSRALTLLLAAALLGFALYELLTGGRTVVTRSLVHEPMTALTDAVLAVVSIAWGWRVLRSESRPDDSRFPDPARRAWGLGLVTMGLGAGSGGAWHAVAPELTPGASAALWAATLLLVGASVLLLVAGAAYATLRDRAARGVVIGAFAELVPYAGWAAQSRSFLPAAAQSGLGLVVLALLSAAGRRWNREASAWMARGIAVSTVAALIEALRIAPHPAFNHDALFHVVQIGGTWCFYRAGMVFRRAPSG